MNCFKQQIVNKPGLCYVLRDTVFYMEEKVFLQTFLFILFSNEIKRGCPGRKEKNRHCGDFASRQLPGIFTLVSLQ